MGRLSSCLLYHVKKEENGGRNFEEVVHILLLLLLLVVVVDCKKEKLSRKPIVLGMDMDKMMNESKQHPRHNPFGST